MVEKLSVEELRNSFVEKFGYIQRAIHLWCKFWFLNLNFNKIEFIKNGRKEREILITIVEKKVYHIICRFHQEKGSFWLCYLYWRL